MMTALHWGSNGNITLQWRDKKFLEELNDNPSRGEMTVCFMLKLQCVYSEITVQKLM